MRRRRNARPYGRLGHLREFDEWMKVATHHESHFAVSKGRGDCRGMLNALVGFETADASALEHLAYLKKPQRDDGAVRMTRLHDRMGNAFEAFESKCMRTKARG